MAIASEPQVRPNPTRPQPRELPPYKVILHNDDVHTMLYVTATIIDLLHVSAEAALAHMFEAHTAGQALLTVTHRERAELLAEQFHSKGLIVTIESAR